MRKGPGTKVPVPLGGGIDQHTHEWLVRPPAAAEVQNLDLDSNGAYTKREGFEPIVQVGTTTGTILLPQAGALGVLGPAGLSVLTSDSPADQEFDKLVEQTVGSALPSAVEAHRVYSFRGAVSGAQIAYNDGRVGLVLTEADEEDGRRAVGFVLDATTWTIISGPLYFPTLAHGCRVEPVDISGFLFLGVDIDTSTPRTSPTINGSLNAACWMPENTDPTPFTVSQISVPAANDLNLLYDSFGLGSGELYVYVSYLSGGNLCCTAVDAYGGTIDTIVAASSGCNHAVWGAGTVVIYNSSTRKFHYTDSELSGAWQTTNASYTIRGDVPMFYQRVVNGVAHLWLNDRKVLFSGTSPGTPVAAGSDRWTPTLHRRPQPREEGGSFFFHCYATAEVENYGDPLVAGGEQITTNESVLRPSGFTIGFERQVVPLSEGRLELWRMAHFHSYYWFDDPNTKRTIFGVNGQSARADGKLLVPQLVANSAYLAPPLQRAHGGRLRVPTLVGGAPTYSSISGGDFASADEANFGRSIVDDGGGGWLRTNDIAHRTGGAGVNEGAAQLVVSKIDVAPTEFSAIDFFGSTLVAAGGVSVFDGSISLPATLETPTLVVIENDSTQDNVYQTSPPTTDAAESFRVDAGQSVSFRGVLFAIDRNGVKYRSDSFTMGFIENSSGGTAIYFPKWTLRLKESHKSFVFAGRKLGVEIYASAEYAVTDPPAPEPSSHTFVMRTAVQYNGSSGDFFVSGSRLWDIDDAATPYSIHDYNPTALYTETELGPEQPPASNVLAHAGNYLFLLSSEDPWLVWHSKPISASIGPEFHSTLTLRMPTESGGCVSLAGEADRILFLCRNGVYELFVAGSGPDAEGTGAFPSMRRVYAGDGCINHACTVSGPFGTFFLSSSGPKIVGRDGEIVDVGEQLGVDASSFLHATYDPIEKEIWLSRGEDGYILDTSRMAWTYTSLASYAATIWNRAFYRVNGASQLLRRSSEEVQDAGVSYQARYVSPWLTFEGQMGYSRVRKVGVLVQVLENGTGKLRIKLAYDYVDTDVDTFEYDFTDLGALAKPAQVWVRPTRQKLDALRVTVEDAGE